MKQTLTRYGISKTFIAIVLLCVIAALLAPKLRAETDPKFYAVQVSATVQTSPAQISLTWPADANANGYTVYRKSVTATSWGTVTSLSGSATSYVDSSVSVGVVYEYQISKTTTIGYKGYGYITAAINAPLVESRGKVIFMVDNLYAADLATELTRMQQDLVGDGWTVLRHDVSRNDSVVNIKNIIKADYNADPSNVKSVFLFGHIPVPYSGDFNPDGHPDHRGAWAADSYYGDMNGNWTDSSVNNTGAEKAWNRNAPGDGKFDQSDLPSDVDLQVGRVDLANMSCFANVSPARSEKDLLRQYLNKDHNFRHRLINPQRRGLVTDSFGERDGEAFAASGWRNFAPFFGANNVTSVSFGNYFPTLQSESYLWSYGTGGGGWTSCWGTGNSVDFAKTNIQSVFTMFLGSYFGDWDNDSAFLRAPLGSETHGLTASWAGRPHNFYHHMALGEVIGYSIRLSQNNAPGGLYAAQNYGSRQVHIALMGDPTLRMHAVVPPASLTAITNSGSVVLNWSASTDSNLLGYHVYRSGSANGTFTRVTSSPVTGTSFTDNTSGSYTYMVRAIKLETSGSGTYFNPSQGIFVGATSSGGSTNGTPVVTIPSVPTVLIASAVSSSQINLGWTDASSDETGFRIERKTGASGTYAQVGTVSSNVTSFSNSQLVAGIQYFYRVSANNSAGNSAYSTEATATTASAPSNPSATSAAVFVTTDTTTRGNWKGVHGNEGFNVLQNATSYPAYAQVSTTGNSAWTWNDPTTDTRALQKNSSSDRIAACSYATSTFTVNLNLTDGNNHRVAFYCLDWDNAGRQQTIEISDAATGAVLNTQVVGGFSGGKYLIWDLRGNVKVKFTAQSGPNAEVSGIFFNSTSVPASSTPPRLARVQVQSGNLELNVIGQIGQQFVIESSTNLINWAAMSTNTLTSTNFTYVDTSPRNLQQRFYRSKLLP